MIEYPLLPCLRQCIHLVSLVQKMKENRLCHLMRNLFLDLWHDRKVDILKDCPFLLHLLRQRLRPNPLFLLELSCLEFLPLIFWFPCWPRSLPSLSSG